ncbi:Gnk2-homologous domain-containing protein [Dioscorea alata]|uniref:Gnk2-homologous domain-containing protein n=1 Tax=Dioscorea alata TaxID=55571 RepID=A0ACB7VNU4_DIOAL|nr:Gnk2-homologous domain-containing protein [Dioscorea alata]
MHHHNPRLFHSLALLLLLPCVISIDPLFSICSSSDDCSVSQTFKHNLNKLMYTLANRAPAIGFGLESVGEGHNQVNGLVLCRGDLKNVACSTCIRAAEAHVRKLCPFEKEATIWFDGCLFRYSNNKFFGELDNSKEFCMTNTLNVSVNSMAFNMKVTELMHRLALAAHLSPLLYATGEMEIGESEKLHGLVQCTRDLSGGDCKKCLENAISELPSCSYGKQGGRLMDGSCNIRYELYPFFDA